MPSCAPRAWAGAKLVRVLLAMVRGYRGQLTATFLLGVARVVALIGVGVLSALVVRAVKGGAAVRRRCSSRSPSSRRWPACSTGSSRGSRTTWRIACSPTCASTSSSKLDALAPAYLTRRRSGDLVGVATQDIELIEYFFAHTVTPAFVAVLVPAAVLVTLASFGWPLALALLPFLVYAGLTPGARAGAHRPLGSRARELSGDLNAHAVDSVQGLAELVAFQHDARRAGSSSRRRRGSTSPRASRSSTT